MSPALTNLWLTPSTWGIAYAIGREGIVAAYVGAATGRLGMSVKGALPTFVIIGAQKCGTTALHSYLGRHPEVSMSRPKELDFFIEGRNWSRGVDWYRSRFDPAAKARGESSPDYTVHPHLPGVPERMAELIPEAKLIFMVRDPIERIRANWLHTYSNRVEHRPMREAVLDPDRDYVTRSRYHLQLSRFLDRYPIGRVMVIEQGELLSDRRGTLRRVFGFLDVSEDVWREAFSEQRLETSARRRRTWLGAQVAKRIKPRAWRRIRDRRPFTHPFEQPRMDEALRAELADLLREDIARFRELTGREFATWPV
jgi:hypothetical protein